MKRFPLVPTILLAAGLLSPSAQAQEPSKRPAPAPPALIPFEAFVKFREALGLSEDQVREIGRIAEGMGDAGRKLESERRERTEALQEALAQRPIDLEKAMPRFQGVLQVENEMKALQFRSMVAAQNVLSPEQAEKVRAIAAKMQGSRDGSPAGAAADLRERLDQIRVQLRKRHGGELPKEAVAMLERIEQAAQEGKLAEAKNQMEGLLAQLGNAGEAPKKNPKDPGANAQPSPAEINQAIMKTEKELAESTEPGKREKLLQQLAKYHQIQARVAAGEKSKQPEGSEKPSKKGESETGPK
jgi:hypothetical protein